MKHKVLIYLGLFSILFLQMRALISYKKTRIIRHQVKSLSSSNLEDLVVSYPNFSFTIHKEKIGVGRIGTLVTPHGNIETPNFVFCATKAAMKTVTPAQLKSEGSQFILSNTYHLMLTPGSELIEKMGGLQKFTNWNGPMLTDSGGYQIFR